MLLIAVGLLINPEYYFWAFAAPWAVPSFVARNLMHLPNFPALPFLLTIGGFLTTFALVCVLFDRVRPFAFQFAALLGSVIFLTSAEFQTRTMMKEAVNRLNGACFARNSFLYSLQKAGAEFQFDLHAVTHIDDKWYAWSYGQMDFFELPENVSAGDKLMRRCLAQMNAD